MGPVAESVRWAVETLALGLIPGLTDTVDGRSHYRPETLPVGPAYAVWVGIGAVLTAIIGMVVFDDPVSVLTVGSIVLITSGVVPASLGHDGRETHPAMPAAAVNVRSERTPTGRGPMTADQMVEALDAETVGLPF